MFWGEVGDGGAEECIYLVCISNKVCQSDMHRIYIMFVSNKGVHEQ